MITYLCVTAQQLSHFVTELIMRTRKRKRDSNQGVLVV